jgi:hypothetical protein
VAHDAQSEISPVPTPVIADPASKRWQVTLRSLFLLMAAIAVWTAFSINRERTKELTARIAVMRPLARELMIDDESKITGVKLEELWFDENRWEVYLPKGEYRLCLATRGIDFTGLPPVLTSARIESGRHQLGLEQTQSATGWQIKALWDGSAVLSAEEPLEWNPNVGSSGASEFTSSTQMDPNSPAVFFRRRFMKKDDRGGSATPVEPTEGVMLWIERVPSPKTVR